MWTKRLQRCAILSSPKALAEPLDAAGYAERCSQLTREKEWQAAVADCSEAIRLDPAQVEAWLDRCCARVEVGEADKAVADCREGSAMTTITRPAAWPFNPWMVAKR
ncbi:MAG: hypothetical protein ACK41W_01170 [Cyanobacteriota bacterium]|jgi:hypothetical protein